MARERGAKVVARFRSKNGTDSTIQGVDGLIRRIQDLVPVEGTMREPNTERSRGVNRPIVVKAGCR